ncbi:hypothetical protein EAE99_011233 [Botrytis elliptica]|nr:hypothetical protein EAE99_011233 [Botrytis elliptica]
MNLCAHCRDFITKRLYWNIIPDGPSGYIWSVALEIDKRSPEAFLRSTDYGCYICQRIFCNLAKNLQSQLRGLDGQLPQNKRHGECFKHDMPNPQIFRAISPAVFMGYRIYEDSFSVCFWCGDEYYPCAHFQGRMNLISKELSNILPSWRITSSSTDSKETFAKINKWLERYTSEHIQCPNRRERHKNVWRPTRLLEITCFKSHNKKDLKLRIVDGTQVSTHRQQSVPTEVLSQTFQDAIRAVRRLKVKYIWIDSLCIIQEGDELADWKREAPVMHEVYSNACFNICASWGPTLGRLFTERDPCTVQHATFEMPSKTGWQKKFFLVSSEKGDGAWDELVEDSELAVRGWVFQERLLSPRNIYFCKDIVLYECYEKRWSESMGLDVVPWRPLVSPNSVGANNTSSPTIKKLLPNARSISSNKLYQTWYDLVSKYSDTELTFPSDRLAAIAGIAQQFIIKFKKDNIKDVYVAGLWLSRLSLEMLWKSTINMSYSKQHNLFSRPTHLTFSWISGYWVHIKDRDLEGEDPDEKFILPQVTCVKWRTHAHTDPERYVFTEDIIMPPSTPCIEVMVQGVLKRMRLIRGQDIFHVFPVDAIGVSEPKQDLESLEKCENDSDARKSLFVWAGLDFTTNETEISILNDSKKLFYVPWYDNDDRGSYGLSNSYCLLLELVSCEMGRFRRIGMLNFGPEYRDLYFASQIDEQDYPCWKYDQISKDHTFFIV